MPLHSVNYMLSVCVQNILKLSCRCRHKSHYDVLRVAKDCSTREIKESFIELSKKFHPDVNSGGKSHTAFLRISEAYNILSRPLSRRKYDAELALRLQEATWPRKDLDPDSLCWACRTWSDSTIWNARRATAGAPQKSNGYYGIVGIKKVPHIWIVAICLTTAGLALIVEIFLISHAGSRARERMVIKSKSAEEALASVRAEAARFGNEEQFRRLLARAKLKAAVTMPGLAAKPKPETKSTTVPSTTNLTNPDRPSPANSTKSKNVTTQNSPSRNIFIRPEMKKNAETDAATKQ